MNNETHAVEKLRVIKELAREASVRQVCDVLVEYLQKNNKENIGFKDEKAA